jgi:5-methylcytosine-specific restriction endonuclease McrA
MILTARCSYVIRQLSMAKHLCKCGAITNGHCTRCNNNRQQSTTQRGYDGDWKRLSERYRNENPLCEVCMLHGRTTPCDHVHHIVPIRDCKALRLEWGNLIAVCEECHREIEGKGDPRKEVEV